MKKVHIIHGWDFKPESNWYPWLKKELEAEGFEVIIPEMPKTEEPDIETWVNHLAEAVKDPGLGTYLVGHSIGCQAIMRYLETLDNIQIGGAVFVAGWFYLKNLEGEEIEKIAEPWLNTPINLGNVKKAIGNLKVFLSDNDPYDCLEENSKIFKEQLAAKVIIEKGKGHFTSDDGVQSLPEALEALRSLLRP